METKSGTSDSTPVIMTFLDDYEGTVGELTLGTKRLVDDAHFKTPYKLLSLQVPRPWWLIVRVKEPTLQVQHQGLVVGFSSSLVPQSLDGKINDVS